MEFRPDAYIPDMEDSVPESEKLNARRLVASYLTKLHAVGPLIIPRVNSLDTGLTEEDLASVLGAPVFGISIGKIQTAQDIDEVSRLIGDLEHKRRIEKGRTKLIPWIETARAVVHCHEICAASPRIVAVAFGAEDYTLDMGIARTGDDAESNVAFARNTLCVTARAAGILALDTPYFKFKDEAGLMRNALAGKDFGFKGKFAIHPAQVEAINQAFSPSPREIEHAQRVVAVFAAAERKGRGSTSLDGEVIDVPVVKRARALLELVTSEDRDSSRYDNDTEEP